MNIDVINLSDTQLVFADKYFITIKENRGIYDKTTALGYDRK